MKSKTAFYLYLISIHSAVIAALIVYREQLGWWFFIAEALVILSFLIGARFIKRGARPLEFVQAFSDVIHAGEYNARYRSTGQKEMDELVDVYNQMLSRLQQERLALGEQRGFLERFLQVSPIGVMILNFERQIHVTNPSSERFLNLPTDKLKGQNLNQLNTPIAAHLEQLDLWTSELWNSPTGQRLRCHHGEFNDRGFPRSYYLIEDVTRELQRSERGAYEKLIRMVSHEVNNTVAATNSLLHSCQSYGDELEESDRQDFSHAIDVLITRNSHLNEFTHRLASLARIPEPDKHYTSIEDLVEPIAIIFRPACVERQIQFEVDIEQGLPQVDLDQNLLEQVLINIVKNALEAVDDGGVVSINVSLIKQAIVLSITDNGSGLDKEAKEHLFQPFYTSKPSGQGLGLTLARDILNLHEFSYQLDSESDKTVFEVHIPSRFFKTI
ncbi:sensor histidine kinase [Alteromonadaceae bacterium M269]|nr:sensor histidine kinase [Alteromonadaceae bacterium M269]